MKRKGLAIGLVMCLLITTIGINGCGPLLGATVSTTKVIAAGMSTGEKAKKKFIPKPNIDTKETIIQKFGQPDETIIIDTNKQVLAYETLYGLTNLYALKNEVYQDKTRIRIGEYRANGTLKSELIRIFPCLKNNNSDEE